VRKIDLQSPKKDKESYDLFLGNGTYYTFKSERACKAFVAQTNKFLTQILTELNGLYTDVYVIYRRNWLYLDTDHRNGTRSNDKSNRKIKQELEGVDFVLNQTTFSSTHRHAHMTVFINYKKVCRFLTDAICELKYHAESRGDTVELYTYRSLLKRIIAIENDIDNYGKMECCEIRDIDTSKIPNLFVIPKTA
jgi:hypothetical protein